MCESNIFFNLYFLDSDWQFRLGTNGCSVKKKIYICFLVLQVPTVSTRTVAAINITIQGESTSMSKKTKILIEPPAFIHIIRTDKPIYKPGQTGKFKMLWCYDWHCLLQLAPLAVWQICRSIDIAHIILPALLTNSAALAQFRLH